MCIPRTSPRAGGKDPHTAMLLSGSIAPGQPVGRVTGRIPSVTQLNWWPGPTPRSSMPGRHEFEFRWCPARGAELHLATRPKSGKHCSHRSKQAPVPRGSTGGANYLSTPYPAPATLVAALDFWHPLSCPQGVTLPLLVSAGMWLATPVSTIQTVAINK